MNLAIIGATGNVGRKTVEILERSKIKIDNLFLVASDKSAGKEIIFRNKKIKVICIKRLRLLKSENYFFCGRK